MNKEVYVYFYCDEWKSKSSMRLVGVYDDFNTLLEQIKNDVSNGDIEVEDVNHIGKWNINDIKYGCVQLVSLNQNVS